MVASLSLFFSFSVAQVLINNFVFPTWACAAGFNNNNNNNNNNQIKEFVDKFLHTKHLELFIRPTVSILCSAFASPLPTKAAVLKNRVSVIM